MLWTSYCVVRKLPIMSVGVVLGLLPCHMLRDVQLTIPLSVTFCMIVHSCQLLEIQTEDTDVIYPQIIISL